MDRDALPSRRDALATLAGGVALTVGGMAVAGCGTTRARGGYITSGLVSVGPLQECPMGETFSDYQDRYGIVITNESGTPLAIRTTCTHMGCTVAWNTDDKQFVCPCHGSRFDINGKVVKGPAKRALAAIAVKITPDGDMAVDLDRLYAIPV